MTDNTTFVLNWHDARTERPERSMSYGEIIVAYRHINGSICYYIISYSKKHDKFNCQDSEEISVNYFENDNIVAWAELPQEEFFDIFKGEQ